MAGEPERVVRDYFAALGRRDLEAARAHLAPQLRGTMHGLAEFSRAAAVMDWFTALFAAARESVRRLAALDLREAWPGHGEPLRGDVRAQLERMR